MSGLTGEVSCTRRAGALPSPAEHTYSKKDTSTGVIKAVNNNKATILHIQGWFMVRSSVAMKAAFQRNCTSFTKSTCNVQHIPALHEDISWVNNAAARLFHNHYGVSSRNHAVVNSMMPAGGGYCAACTHLLRLPPERVDVPALKPAMSADFFVNMVTLYLERRGASPFPARLRKLRVGFMSFASDSCP